jgi:hypothetical protein
MHAKGDPMPIKIKALYYIFFLLETRKIIDEIGSGFQNNILELLNNNRIYNQPHEVIAEMFGK